MGYNDHIDDDLNEKLQDLLDEGYFDEDSEEYHVVHKVMEDGYYSLTKDQIEVYNGGIGKALVARSEELAVQQIRNSNPE